MSAYLLSSPRTPTTIADELESFLHILVYGAVRRMESNVHPMRPFLEAYFSGCGWNIDAQTVCCPHAKRDSVVVHQKLIMYGVPIKFTAPGKPAEGHPLNELIASLLKIFHSRYVVLEWEDYHRSGPAAVPMTSDSQLPRNSADTTLWKKRIQLAPELTVDDEDETETPSEAPPQRPTPEMYANVESLATHSKVLRLF